MCQHPHPHQLHTLFLDGNMENDKNELYLLDLDNEKTGEQIVFEQKVFRANEVFRWKMQDLMNWFKLPSDS